MAFSLEKQLHAKGIELSTATLALFDRYYELLIEWNERMNLTAITDRDAVMEKHFYDSISPAFFHDFTHVDRIVDIGAGAGFPSLPLKLVYPHLNVTIVDSLNKRITFLQHLAEQLQLTGVHFVHGRAEEIAHKEEHREQYPFVIARAVARLPVLLELCLPFARVGGTFIALKGSSGEEEITEAAKALQTLGGHVEKTERLHLPSEQSQRTLVWIKKQHKTPRKYPRKAGTPNKAPLL